MRIWLRLGVISLIAIALAGGLWLSGFWDMKSQRYWRHYGQTILFFVAEKVPVRSDTREVQLSLTKLALRTHKAGITTEELDRASLLFERAGAPVEAAELLMALVRRDAKNHQLDAARSHAARSARLRPSSTALLNLVTLNQYDIQERSKWVVKLQAAFPQHEIGLAYRCLGEYRDLEQDPPESCNSVDWANRLAWHRRNEYKRLTEAIKNYEELAAKEVGTLEAELEQYSGDIVGYRRDLEDLNREASGLGFVAIVETAFDWLPIPKPNDTPETFIVREGLCAFPYLRWVCRLGSVGEALGRMDKRKATLAERATRLTELLRLTASLMEYRRYAIKEWQSGRKLEAFKTELGYQHEWFWREVENAVFRKCPELGVDVDGALRQVAGG